MSEAEKQAAMDELQAVEKGLADAMRLGTPRTRPTSSRSTPSSATG